MLKLLKTDPLCRGIKTWNKIGFQIRNFGTSPEMDTAKLEEDNGYLNKDWFRKPQKSDGPRCIDPSYPNPPFASYQTKNPFKRYDDPQLRRNFNDPLHENYEILTVQNFDVETTYSLRYMLTGVAIGAASFIGIIQLANYFDEPNGWRRNVVDK